MSDSTEPVQPRSLASLSAVSFVFGFLVVVGTVLYLSLLLMARPSKLAMLLDLAAVAVATPVVLAVYDRYVPDRFPARPAPASIMAGVASIVALGVLALLASLVLAADPLLALDIVPTCYCSLVPRAQGLR